MFSIIENNDGTLDLYYGDSRIVKDIVGKDCYDIAMQLCSVEK